MFATMEFLSEWDPAGPVVEGGDREVAKRAVDRRRTLLEHRAADKFRAYFREEAAQVTHAVRFSGGLDIKRRAEAAVESLGPDLRETYDSAWGGAARSWGAWAAGHVQLATKRATKAEVPVDEWLRQNAGKRITNITEASRKKIAEQIAEGTAAGETLAQIARRVDKFYLEDVIPNRSAVIARTEVGAAVNWAQHWAAGEAGVEMEKEWLALDDDRTRDDHREADGQRVGLDEPFEVGDDLLMYPSDPSGSPEEVINCRCSVLHHVVGDEEGKAKSSAPGAPTVDEFAAQVAGIENADVATALAFARGVFGVRDDWVWARRRLMKRVYHLRRPAVERHSGDSPRSDTVFR